MSAIAGIYHINKEPVPIEHGNSMMMALQKFPANDVQTLQNENIFLGCHAQWITPESIGEQLPYYDSERKVAITADVIIDNREELFERLQVDRSKQKTIPDSQLILLAYYKWGEECPKYLIGDFAFMIWDEREQILFGARDFSGTRTLYYYQDNKRFAFCTTINPILTLPYVKKVIDEQWFAEFIAISSVVDTVDASITPYKHIEQLPPAHSIKIAASYIRLTRFCTLTPGEQLKLHSGEEYVEAFQDVFNTAVKSRLRTFHHVGAHLSGGLDSGSVVSFAAKQLRKDNKQLQTFSYIPSSGFIDYTHKHLMPDERPFIETTLQHIGGIKNHFLPFEGRNSLSEVDDFLDILEMPYKYFENSFWLKGIFEKAHEEGVGVLLNGGRGNFTISWGHALNYYAILLKKMKWISLIQELHHYSQKAGGARLRRIPMLMKLAYPAINKLSPLYTGPKFPTLINSELAKSTNVFHKLKEYGLDETGWFSTTNIYEMKRRHFEDVFHWNATNTLAAKLSLRYSLWMRDSTNDLRVIRFCLSVPEEQYVQNGLDRSLIRRATENYLPDKIRLNQQVRGVQGADWVHRMVPFWDTFIEEAEQLSEDRGILHFLDGRVIKEALKKVKQGARPDYAGDADYKVLMRSLIIYRYLKNFN